MAFKYSIFNDVIDEVCFMGKIHSTINTMQILPSMISLITSEVSRSIDTMQSVYMAHFSSVAQDLKS